MNLHDFSRISIGSHIVLKEGGGLFTPQVEEAVPILATVLLIEKAGEFCVLTLGFPSINDGKFTQVFYDVWRDVVWEMPDDLIGKLKPL